MASAKQKAAQARFKKAAKACAGKSSRHARNSCMREKLKGHGRGYSDYGSPKGRKHRGKKRRHGSSRGCVGIC